MKLKKLYTYKTKRQIWRLLLSDKNRLIIEDRDPQAKQAFFSCLDAPSGKKLFSEYQLNEKFWVGIEAIYKEIIYFHKFQKPDMPGHKEIIAFSIDEKKILWENDNYNFLFIKNDRVYTFRQKYDTRDFYALDYLTGELIEELGNDHIPINEMREKLYNEDDYKNYYFPESLSKSSADPLTYRIMEPFLTGEIIGNIEYVSYGDLILMNYHTRESGYLTNTFFVLNTTNRKLILKEVINHFSKAVVPDSFFIKDDLLFVLKDRQELMVYKIS